MTARSAQVLFMVLISAFMIGGVAHAEPVPDTDPAPRERALQQVRNELETVEKRWYTLTRVRWGYPLSVSAGIGAMLAEQPVGSDCSIVCSVSGWHFEIEPGRYGIQGSLGWGRLVGETGGSRNWLHTVNWGWSVRGTLLRTWGDGHMGPETQTFAGIEGGLSIVRLHFTVGLMRSLSSASDENWVLTGAFGWGF